MNGGLVDCDSEDCEPDLACGAALTCCDGMLYPTTCCDANCDEPIGECDGGQGDCESLSQDECSDNMACDWVVEYIVNDNGDMEIIESCMDSNVNSCFSYNEDQCEWHDECIWNDWGFCEDDNGVLI